jgi:sirohydrochlorin ferrochelatase
MGWFRRKSSTIVNEPDPTSGVAADVSDQDEVIEPSSKPISEADRTRIAEAVDELASEGVDVDDLASIEAGLDAAYREWATTRTGPHDAVVTRYALGIGEYLDRHTDLDWQIVTDVFGTDLGVAGGFRSAFVVVPGNLVAGRWMRGETAWVQDVVGHIERIRQR